MGRCYRSAMVRIDRNKDRAGPSDSHVDKEPIMKKFLSFLKDESGATAIEYGLIAAGISVAIIAVVQGIGSNLNTKFTSIQTALN